jgi:hypothetical protein
MTPSEFLRAVWPETGIYCLAIPRGNGAFRHRTYDTIDQAAADAAQFAGSCDIYFNIHTLREKQVPHKDAAKAAAGETQVRVQRNMVEAKCFFFDLDIGDAAGKYASRNEALSALIKFVADTQLPKPLVTSSGGGFHVYWLLSEPMPTDEWRDHATRLRQLATHYGLKADPSRTTDSSSVLRVVGTKNWKDRRNPRPVQVVAPGKPTAAGVFVKSLNEAIIRAGVTPQSAPQLMQAESLFGPSNMTLEYDGPQPSMVAVLTACQQVRRIAALKGQITEPEWYRIAIGVGRFTENGNRNVHKLSHGHPGYSQQSCNAKIKQNELSQKGPSSCASVAYASSVGDSLCTGCPFQGRVYGPIQAALFKDPAPPPLHEERIGDQVVTTNIPDPPKPFIRLKDGGGIAIVSKNADGTEEPQKIFDYDLYPVRRLSNVQQGVEQQVWHVALPRGEAKNFTLDADMLYDMRKFVVAIAHQGIYPHKGHIPTLQEYMVAYIAQLQKLADADAQCNHLGWGDDQKHFILPDKVMYPDGSVKPAQLSLGAQRASKDVHSRGTLEEQVKLLTFYNSPAYLPNQFFILASLAAPIFYATGHHGVIVNASGEAGASKSTSLYTAASFWGQPELYPINGTNNGATVRGRNERVTVLANLPVCVDEITHMPIKDAVDLAMSITQPGHRIRLETSGVERASVGSYKATIMLATANNSLHSMLSLDNAAGTAGSMRVFEIVFKACRVHEKWEADQFLFKLKENFGHIGEQFIYHVLTHQAEVCARVREVMQEIDKLAGIRSAERFWSATAAGVLVAGEIAYKLGLLPYSVDALKRWVLEHQIPYMRGVVTSEYSDPLALLADYLESINGNIIRMQKSSGGNISNVIHMPRTGELLAHFDLDDRMMYVLKTGFKHYCARTGANATKIIGDLYEPRDGVRVIPQTHTRRVLGAGTEAAKAQSWCFAINMAHPAVSGIADLKVVGGSDVSKAPLSIAT